MLNLDISTLLSTTTIHWMKTDFIPSAENTRMLLVEYVHHALGLVDP